MAYAAVLSTKKKLEHFLYSSQSEIPLPAEIVRSIYGKLGSLESVLETYISMRGRKLRFDPLEGEIEDVADKIIDLMESLITSDSDESGSLNDEINKHDLITFSQKLLDVKQDISSLTEKADTELQNMEEEEEEEEKQASNPHVVSSRICHSSVELVGLEDELRQLMDWLMESSETCNIISVSGMAGIGKTTLVQQVYNHPSTVSHFDTRIMVTIGPNFRLQEFLQVVLGHVGVVDVVDRRKLGLGVDELGMRLHRFLMHRRYLIVLDDVWDFDVWDNLEKIFPLHNNRSRIIFTSRLSTVFISSSNTSFYDKRFLDDDDSWNLLRRMVFTNPNESCSYQLEKIGKKIAKNCEGLPLAIISIGHLLSQAEKTVEYWKKISEDENPLKIGVDDNSLISKSLHLSYAMLERYLKPCFLLAGVFPRNYKIVVSELIRLWAVEGFIPPQYDSCTEVAGGMLLENLLRASVVLDQARSSISDQSKICRIHCVFRNLCISIAEKEKFCHVLNRYAYSFPRGTNHQQRLCIHNNVMLSIREVYNTMDSISSVRSVLCLGSYHPYPSRVHFNFKLLKILNALTIRFYTFPHQILNLVLLEYLAISYDGELPKSISKLHNLEVLIVRPHQRVKSLDAATAFLPTEIWNLKWVKHLQCLGFDLLDSCIDDTDLQNLETLSGVSARSCTGRVLARMPNLRKLGICIELGQDEKESFSFLNNVAKTCHRLQSFKFIVSGFNSHIVTKLPRFPPYTAKLTMSGCKFSWKCMASIWTFSLKVLKLRSNAFCGSVWKPCKLEFQFLEFLLLEDLDVETWKEKSKHFPRLRRLIIKHCYKLRQIPMDFGKIEALEMIEVEDGRPSLTTSAKEIQRYHQHKYGNDKLQVRIHCSWEEKKNT